MRSYWFTVAGLLILTAAGTAQQPPARPPAAPDPAQEKLDELLAKWEKSMQSVQSLAAQLVRTEINPTLQTKDVFVGGAQFVRPNRAILWMAKEKTPNDLVEKFICTGNHLYQFAPHQKEIRVIPLPQSKTGQLGDDNLLSFLFGMKATDAKERYDLKLAKEDQHYLYVEIVPRRTQDKVEFQKARLVLHKDSFLPRQLWFQQPNQDEVIWDLPRIDSGAKLNLKDFDAPAVPQGWKLVEAARSSEAPRVVRPQK